tara:strand:+ start:2080 stop:4152 length:2073 start_codon:yes stop_codon:yes gene_type:complete
MGSKLEFVDAAKVFSDIAFFEIPKLINLKDDMSKKRKGSSSIWAQMMVEQISLFYKIVNFHQDCLRIVLTLIRHISDADEKRINIITDVLGEKAKIQIDKEKIQKINVAESDPDDTDTGIEVVRNFDQTGKSVLSSKYAQTRAEVQLDDEIIAQQERRVVALKNSRKIRLLYYLLYNNYRISENDLVKIEKDHSLSVFIKHFNAFIGNKTDTFNKTPIKEQPKNSAEKIRKMRDLLVGEKTPLQEWEKVWLFMNAMNDSSGSDFLGKLGGSKFGSKFGANPKTGDEFKFLEREIYEFTLERLIIILFEEGFNLDRVNLIKFFDDFKVSTKKTKRGKKKSVSAKAELYVEQMLSAHTYFKKGLFKKPIGDDFNANRVFEFVLEDAYLRRPLQLLETVPNYPKWMQKVFEFTDHQTWLVNQCRKTTESCMPGISLGRVMHFIMSHLLYIQNILSRLSRERFTAAANTYKYTKNNLRNENLFLLLEGEARNSAKNVFKKHVDKINLSDLYSMAILDSETWDFADQKRGDDMLFIFFEPRSMVLFEGSNEEDPHLKSPPKKGALMRKLKYNDFENVLFRAFSQDKMKVTMILHFEKVFLSWALSRWSRLSKTLRPQFKRPLLSDRQLYALQKAFKETDKEIRYIEANNFGLLKNKVKIHGIYKTLKYLKEINKRLNLNQKTKNKKYINYLIKNN